MSKINYFQLSYLMAFDQIEFTFGTLLCIASVAFEAMVPVAIAFLMKKKYISDKIL